MSAVEWTDEERAAVVARWRDFLGYEMAREDVIATATLDALAPFVAAREAQAAAKALREAANALAAAEVLDDDRWAAPLLGYYGETDWLRDRADRIERGESDGQ